MPEQETRRHIEMRILTQYPAQNYIGQSYIVPIKLGPLSGVSCPFIFNWLSYGASTANPNIVVNLDMSGSLVAGKLGNLRSVYIDNTGSDVPIYIQFPDTGETIVCQPNCTIWAPCYTQAMKCIVAGLGFFTGDIPTTYIIFTNLPVPPATNIEIQTAVALWRGSSTITRGNTIYSTNFGTPALGDQTISYKDTINAIGVFRSNLWGTPLPNGFIILTHIDVKCYNAVAAASMNNEWLLESTGISGTLYDFIAQQPAGQFQGYDVLNMNSMNIKLDATQTWRLRATTNATTSLAVHVFNWTTSPN
jgi:hypothetical protein